jgi:hypothetical protein
LLIDLGIAIHDPTESHLRQSSHLFPRPVFKPVPPDPPVGTQSGSLFRYSIIRKYSEAIHQFRQQPWTAEPDHPNYAADYVYRYLPPVLQENCRDTDLGLCLWSPSPLRHQPLGHTISIRRPVWRP